MVRHRLCCENWKGILAVFGGFILHLSLGSVYSWGNFTSYVTSYIRLHSSPKTLQYKDSIWVYSVGGIAHGASVALGGLIERKIGARLATLTGALLMSFAVFISGFTIKYNFYLFLVTYGLLFGVGVGIAYAIPLSLAMKWFPRHKGAMNGVIVAGFGGGAFIIDFIQTAYLNPNNIQAVGAAALNTTQDIGDDKYFNDEAVLSKVPSSFFLQAGVFVAMQVIGVCLMFTPPLETFAAYSEISESSPTVQEEERSMPPKEVLKSRHFLTLWFMFFCNNMAVIFISTLYKTYGANEVINDDRLLSILGSLSALFNASGRIFWGHMSDRFSFKLAIVCLSAAMGILMPTLYLSHILADSAGVVILFVWVCLIFFSFSGSFSLFPTAVAKTFGQKNVSVNYGMLFVAGAVAGPLGSLTCTLTQQHIHSSGLFLLAGFLSFISMILGLTFDAKLPDGRAV